MMANRMQAPRAMACRCRWAAGRRCSRPMAQQPPMQAMQAGCNCGPGGLGGGYGGDGMVVATVVAMA